MGRKRKRHRKAEPPAERAERGMVHDEAVEEEEEEQDGEDSTTTNPPMAEPSAAGGCKEVSEAAAAAEEEDIGKLLEPFTRDELLDLLTDACLRDPALLARMASDAAHRRLFVHGLGPGATSAALAAAFALFGALDECHVVADRATSRCRGYGFVTYSRRSDARRALADASKRVGGHPVACQLASLGPVAPSSSSSFSDRKLFVDNVPERVTHDELRRFFSRFGEIEEGPLGADRATGRFRGYAIFFYKSPEGLGKALEEPNKVFDGCELQCRRAHRVSKRKHAPAAPPDTGGQSSDGAVAAALPAVHHEDIALTPKQPLLGSNPLVELTVKGSSSATATVLFRQNAGASGAGILGAAPVATALPSSPSYSASSTPPSRSGAALGHGGLSATARAGSSLMMPTTIGANNSLPHLQVQGSGAVKSQVSTGPGLIQHYLGR